MKKELPKGRQTEGIVGYVETITLHDKFERVSEGPVRVLSANALGKYGSGRLYISAIKRLQNGVALGPCFVGGAGWNATANANFNMEGLFGPVMGADRPSL